MALWRLHFVFFFLLVLNYHCDTCVCVTDIFHFDFDVTRECTHFFLEDTPIQYYFSVSCFFYT